MTATPTELTGQLEALTLRAGDSIIIVMPASTSALAAKRVAQEAKAWVAEFLPSAGVLVVTGGARVAVLREGDDGPA